MLDFFFDLLRAKRGAHNPNLQFVITYASYVCSQHSQHSFGLPRRMCGMHRMHFDQARLDPLSLVFLLITRVLTIFHVKLAQSTALEQKRFS